ncbi:hypothetical protein ACIQ6V_32745 [Streptomyces sp. NPDC096198]|uniref:hypothetical protein n=1 Tax=Streptomyces sp. NPDC096198 TaxID=3366080 RepID=UPI00381E9CAE
MESLLDVELTLDQRSLLTTIGHHWLSRGEWPLWANVQYQFDMRGEDAEAIFQSLPRIGVDAPYAAGYGFTVAKPAPISPRHRVSLTVAASIKLPEVSMAAGEPFVKALRYMIDLYTSRPMHFEVVPNIIMRSDELTAALPDLKPWFVKVLPDMLSAEPLINTGGVGVNGGWEREVTRTVLQYRGVDTVEEYVARTCEAVIATAAQYAPAPAAVEAPVAAPERGPYIAIGLLDDLDQAAQKTGWKVHKLIGLCRELNDNYVAGNPYACAALIRAVLDHIPPVFGHQDFKQVAAQYAFTVKRTDKAHAQRLAAFKDIADDVMHRPISATVPVIGMNDLPEPARLNAVLQELLSILR